MLVRGLRCGAKISAFSYIASDFPALKKLSYQLKTWHLVWRLEFWPFLIKPHLDPLVTTVLRFRSAKTNALALWNNYKVKGEAWLWFYEDTWRELEEVRVPRRGGVGVLGALEPWSPNLFFFLLFGAPEPHVFAAWSPEYFSIDARSPKSFLWSPEPDSDSSILVSRPPTASKRNLERS